MISIGTEILQEIMKVLVAATILAVTTAANIANLCPKLQEDDWEIELLLSHRDCNKYYQCTHGQPVEMSCPPGLYFSIINQVCDWRENVECGDRVVPDESKPEDCDEADKTTPDSDNDNLPDEIQTEKPDIPIMEFLPNGCPVNFEKNWMLPHEYNCSLFYHCVQGKRNLGRCPFWLHFNRELQICDWPRNAGCLQFEK